MWRLLKCTSTYGGGVLDLMSTCMLYHDSRRMDASPAISNLVIGDLINS